MMNRNSDYPAKNNNIESMVLNKFNSHKKEMKPFGEKKEKSIDEVEQKWIMNEKILNLFVNNIENDQKIRNKYAIILIAMLGIMLLALITIFILAGCGILRYSDTTFNLFITGGIAEIFILVRVIVKYLFKDNLTNALTIILKHNNQLTYQSHIQEKRIYKNNFKSSDKPREI